MTNITRLFADRKVAFDEALYLAREEEAVTPQGRSQRWNKLAKQFHSGEFAILDQLSYQTELPVNEVKSTIATVPLLEHGLIAYTDDTRSHYRLTADGIVIVSALWEHRYKSVRQFA